MAYSTVLYTPNRNCVWKLVSTVAASVDLVTEYIISIGLTTQYSKPCIIIHLQLYITLYCSILSQI